MDVTPLISLGSQQTTAESEVLTSFFLGYNYSNKMFFFYILSDLSFNVVFIFGLYMPFSREVVVGW